MIFPVGISASGGFGLGLLAIALVFLVLAIAGMAALCYLWSAPAKMCKEIGMRIWEVYIPFYNAFRISQLTGSLIWFFIWLPLVCICTFAFFTANSISVPAVWASYFVLRVPIKRACGIGMFSLNFILQVTAMLAVSPIIVAFAM